MTPEEFLEKLDRLVAEKHLLRHPFYLLWNEGKLTKEHLREYAISYYPHVAAFPRYVSGVHSNCADASLHQELLENLIEEERGSDNHLALWRRFAAALGAAEGDLAPRRARPRSPTRSRSSAGTRMTAPSQRALRRSMPTSRRSRRSRRRNAKGWRGSTALRTPRRRASSPCTRRLISGTGRSSGKLSDAWPPWRKSGRRRSRRPAAASTR